MLELHIADTALEVLLVIEYEDPENVQEAVEDPEVQVLVFMQPVFFLALAHPHPGLDIDIIVHTINICEGMVDHIVFHVPHEAVSAEDIQRESGKYIQPFVFAEAAMGTVVHHVEADRCYQSAEDHTLYDLQPHRRCKEDQVYIYECKTDTEDDRFQEKLVVTGGGFAYFFKVGADPFFQLGMERVGDIGKLGNVHLKTIKRNDTIDHIKIQYH